MLSEKRIVRVRPDVPWVASWNFRKEIIRVADKEGRLVLWHLGVEKDLRSLRHAGNGFHAKVAESGNRPGIEISGYEVATIFCGDKGIEHELCTRGIIRSEY